MRHAFAWRGKTLLNGDYKSRVGVRTGEIRNAIRACYHCVVSARSVNVFVSIPQVTMCINRRHKGRAVTILVSSILTYINCIGYCKTFILLLLLRIRPSDPFQFRINFWHYHFRHLVGLLGRGIGPSHRISQYRKTWTHVHASSGIRTHNRSVRPVQDLTRRKPGRHCDRKDIYHDIRFQNHILNNIWVDYGSSGFWRRVDSSVDANVSEKHTVSIFRANISPKPRRTTLSSPPWKPQISDIWVVSISEVHPVAL
jgi:hypothetical protein